jgi:signal transduction histidine kinase
MNLLLLSHGFTVFASLALGALVWGTNPRRLVNQCFLLLSIVLALWLIVVGVGILSHSERTVVIVVRLATTIAGFAAPLFNLLRLSMTNRATSWSAIFRLNAIWLGAATVITLLCLSPFLIQGARIPSDSTGTAILEPVYGPGIHLYASYLAISLLLLVHQFIRDMRQSRGIQRVELQFAMLGSAIGIFFALCTAVLIPIFSNTSQSVQLLPFSVLVLDGITAYGIATRRILDVAGLVRRATAYALLALYLVAIYVAFWLASHLLFTVLLGGPDFTAHLIATLATAFSLAPANGLLQQFANRLFLNMRTVDATELMQQANRILNSVAARDDMLHQFATLLSSTFGTDRVTVALKEDGVWRTRYPFHRNAMPVHLTDQHPVIEVLSEGEEPLVSDVLSRFRVGPKENALAKALQDLEASIAVGIHAPDGLRGAFFMGSRLSGRIYSWDEQRALQVLGNQLSVGLENTALYTRLQNNAIYNDILLDNLVSGVIAASVDRRITVYNREAQRIVGRPASEILRQPLSVLPPALAMALETTFARGIGQRNVEAALRGEGPTERPIRWGTTLFHSHTGKNLGALLVFDDLSALKILEEQVRRTDRLASLGTLSAGMAHEIKNPLVTLMTFTQLLPERYEDPDFRATFSSLVGQEVKRIDTIVNQLLRFARPVKPSLRPTHLHEVVEHTLRLVHQQLRQKGIELQRDLTAPNDQIEGDNDLLVQALLNLFLNAVDAMVERGTLSVSTAILEADPLPTDPRLSDTRLRLSIRDNGRGILPQDLPHVFDPFFTTKSTGTGLGLSVSHGIIHKHHASIEVESQEGVGTVFHLIFPLLKAEVPA